MDVYLGRNPRVDRSGTMAPRGCEASVVFVTWEYPLYLFVLCIAQAMLTDGVYALAPSRLRAK